MKTTHVLIIAACVAASVACSTQAPTTSDAAKQSSVVAVPQNPQQAVIVLKYTLLASLSIIEDYKALPVCGGAALLCRTPSVESKLVAAANSAAQALDVAEKAVRTPGFGVDAMATAQASAVAAINSLTLLTNSLKTR